MSEYSVDEILAEPDLLLTAIPAEQQTEKLCLELVEQDPLMLRYMKHQTEAVVLSALRQKPWLIEYAEPQTEAMCLMVVKANGCRLSAIKNPSLDVILAALNQNSLALEYVKLPFDRIMSPGSGQLEAWVTVLRACKSIDGESITKVLHPLIKAVRLGKQHLDLWSQPVRPNVLMLDLLTELASHIRRLHPSGSKVQVFICQVNRQAELILEASVTPREAPQQYDRQEVTL